MTVQLAEQKSDLENRLTAQLYLAKSGWRCRIDNGSHQGEAVELYVALHDDYPQQSALTVVELVRRCNWQETYRTLTKNPKSTL